MYSDYANFNAGARIGGGIGAGLGALKGATSQSNEIDPMTGQRKRIGIGGRLGRVAGNTIAGGGIGAGVGWGAGKGYNKLKNAQDLAFQAKNTGLPKPPNPDQLAIDFSYPNYSRPGYRSNFRHQARYLARF